MQTACHRDQNNYFLQLPNKNGGKLSGQSTLSEDENEGKAASTSAEDSTLTLNDQQAMSRQSSANKRKDSKYSKSRSPIMQSLNPTQLPSSILKAESSVVLDVEDESSSSLQTKRRTSFESKRSLQRTSRVDSNDPEQPLLSEQQQAKKTEGSPVPSGVVPTNKAKSNTQVNSGWL